ncbi:MAG: hypothetical protein R3Y49_04980 [Rikenellaceae bacterium]
MSFFAIVVAAVIFIIYAFGGKKSAQNGENFPFPAAMDDEPNDQDIVLETKPKAINSTPPEILNEQDDVISATSARPQKKIDFDAKKAIIYNAILEPKFKEFE